MGKVRWFPRLASPVRVGAGAGTRTQMGQRPRGLLDPASEDVAREPRTRREKEAGASTGADSSGAPASSGKATVSTRRLRVKVNGVDVFEPRTGEVIQS